MREPRERVLARLRVARASGRSLLAASAASGLVAASCEVGGADLIAVYSSGRFRAAGWSSLAGLLPYADANAVTLELAAEVLAVVEDVPVIVGLCGTDPFRDVDRLVAEAGELGVAGIQNFPTIGLFDERFRADLEATGISFEREVELVRAAGRAGLLSLAFVTTPDDARRMALAGTDVLVAHLGVTRPGDGEAALVSAARAVDAIAEGGWTLRDDLLVLFHGGPAASPSDVARILALSRVEGFVAASSIERFPVAKAVADATRSFVHLRASADADASSPPAPAPDFTEPPPRLPLELDAATLPAYLEARGLVRAGDDLAVEELGGGVSNVVLRWRTGGRCGVVKQSRPRLRVEEEWFADVRRVLNERDALVFVGARLPSGAVPAVTFGDERNLAFGMECAPPDSVVWKSLLLEGHLDAGWARRAGSLLARIHLCALDDAAAARRFVARPLLDQTRLDPWYRAAAGAHPDLEPAFEHAIDRLLAVRRVLVHGDFVPKNMLVSDDRILLVDWEVVHFGNPGYDVATFVNHMCLKGFRAEASCDGFAELAGAFWDAYRTGMPQREHGLVEQEALVQLGPLMLARIDGRSPVEYLVGKPEAAEARAFARSLLRTRSTSLADVLRRYTCWSPPTPGG